jgi:signal transduction histidine kinase
MRVLILACPVLLSVSVSAQDMDSLYFEFRHSGEKRFTELANAISAAAGGDGAAFTPQTPRDEVSAQVAKTLVLHYYNLQRFGDVVRHAARACEIYRQARDTLNLAGCIHTLAIAHHRLGDFDRAIECYYQSADLLAAAGADPSQRRYRYVLNNIADIYLHVGDLDMAWQMYDRCIELLNDMESEEDNMKDLANYLSNLSKVCCREAELLTGGARNAKLAEAVSAAERACELSERYNDEAEKRVERLISLAQVYIASRRYDRAEEAISEASAMAAENSLIYLQGVILENSALLASEKGDAAAAGNYYDRAIGIAEDNGYNELFQQLTHKAYLNSRVADPARALGYHERYVALRDSVVNQDARRQIDEFRVRYDTQGKELEIIRQQAEIERHDARVLMLRGGFLAVAVLLGLSVWIAVLRTRRARILAEMNATKDRFFDLLSHDLKNPAIAQRDALRLLADHSGQWDAPTLSTHCRELLKSADAQVELLYGLLDRAQVQTGRMPYRPVRFDLAAVLRPEIELAGGMARGKGVALDVSLPPAAIVVGDAAMIATVVRNLLSNAVKFTPGGGRVSLRVAQKGGGVEVAVTDTGIGIDGKRLLRLLATDRRKFRRPACRRHCAAHRDIDCRHSGIGLNLWVCRELLEKHTTRLHIERCSRRREHLSIHTGRMKFFECCHGQRPLRDRCVLEPKSSPKNNHEI